MKKLLNTLYVTDEKAYLSLEGEAVVCKSEGKPTLKLPLANIQNIVCFSYLGCSPAFMGKCAENGIPICFFTPNGRFLARVSGKVQGNVYTRTAQLKAFENNCLPLIQNTVAAKLSNTAFLLSRSLRDNAALERRDELSALLDEIKSCTVNVYEIDDIDVIRGTEGIIAKKYFELFGCLLLNRNPIFDMNGRSKYPPLDAVNAMLSFLYSMATNDIASALEGVGLDSYMGFYHVLRSGRVSLACDLVEEVRAVIDRYVITMINLKIVDEKDFEKQIGGAVYLNDNGRKKVLKFWQDKKRDTLKHPYLKEKMQYGILPFVQANFLAKFVRGEIKEYPPFIQR